MTAWPPPRGTAYISVFWTSSAMQRTDDDVRSAAACRSLGTWKYDLVELCDTTIGSCDTTIGSYDGWTRQTAETVDYRRSPLFRVSN